MAPLQVELVQFYIERDAEKSHTEQYNFVKKPETEDRLPVLRRGATTLFNVRFNKKFDESKDHIAVTFKLGPHPTVERNTLITLRTDSSQNFENNPALWYLRIERNVSIESPKHDPHTGEYREPPNDVMLEVHIASNAPVGEWSCTVNEKENIQNLYILFNPWSPFDDVYMSNVTELKEYVQNEFGKIWCGSYDYPKGRPWIFGQFDDIALEIAIELLNKSRIPYHDRASPVAVTRGIAAMINAVDKKGLMEARWDGNYDDGVSPFAWTGSGAILQKYKQNKFKPVKYGQCWVYSAVVVTICRALGIPCRSVTNYVSSYDTDSSYTIDKYFDKHGKRIVNGPKRNHFDSCWNYHAWNEVWMARNDLAEGYGGWQVIDATPQEPSDGRYRLGPAPLTAIRKGQLDIPYDTRFIFTETCAQVCHFIEDEKNTNGYLKTCTIKYMAGRRIVTKYITNTIDDKGDSDLWDITSNYKNQAEIQEPCTLTGTNSQDVDFHLVDTKPVPLGREFFITLEAINKAKKERKVHVILVAETMYYTGKRKDFIKRHPINLILHPGQRELLAIKISPSDYLNKLVDDDFIKIYAIAKVDKTDQIWSEEDDLYLYKPELQITTVNESDNNVLVQFSFENPLEESLTNCSYMIQGPGVYKRQFVDYEKIRTLGNYVSFQESLKKGLGMVVVTFDSQEIRGIRAVFQLK